MIRFMFWWLTMLGVATVMWKLGLLDKPGQTLILLYATIAAMMSVNAKLDRLLSARTNGGSDV